MKRRWFSVLLMLFVHSAHATPFTTVNGAAQAIESLTQTLSAKHDRRALFAGIYVLTLRATQQKLAHGEFRNPAWVEALAVNYAAIYWRTINRELSGQRGQLPRAWQDEFAYIDSTHVWTPLDPGGRLWSPDLDVVYGIHVHIARDLVEALFVTSTDFQSLSQNEDFLLITEVLRSAMPDIWTLYLSYEQQAHLSAAIEEPRMMNWIAKLRAQAWQDAKAGAALSSGAKAGYLDQIDAAVADESQREGIFQLL